MSKKDNLNNRQSYSFEVSEGPSPVFDVVVQVTILTKLKYQIDVVTFLDAIVELHDVGTVEEFQIGHLIRLLFLLNWF